jgi:hypothetical protein
MEEWEGGGTDRLEWGCVLHKVVVLFCFAPNHKPK